tara:strand:+ start:766 stop:951 length:186 start_codon:yes stop_codon:yes gene_type:complete
MGVVAIAKNKKTDAKRRNISISPELLQKVFASRLSNGETDTCYGIKVPSITEAWTIVHATD